jgi:protein-tyrosine phosphatase
MSVKVENVNTSEYNLIYYMNHMYTKLNCIIRSYSNNHNVFEASEILNGMYIGNINSVYDFNKLKEVGITHVISVLAGFNPPFPNDFKYLVLNALDTTNTDISKNFKSTNDFIDNAVENGGKVLVHCMAGRSRSVTILAAYIINTYGFSVEKTLDFIKNKRNIIEPNIGFKNQLISYYNDLYSEKK